MSSNSSLVAQLREKTGCGIKDCKFALDECKGDLEKAIEYLRKKGLASAGAKSGRATNAGRVVSYIHSNGQIGVLVELNCETDFVANTDIFQELGKDLCMHICAMKPIALDRQSLPKEIVEKEKEIYQEQMKTQLKDKPPEAQEKILVGKLDKFYKDFLLMEQLFVKDDKKSGEEIIKEKIATLKENITIKRFARYQLGE